MNILNKVALQGMKRNPTRTLVTIAGVILATALFTSVATFAVSLQAYMVNGASLRYGGWHVEVFGVPQSFMEEQGQSGAVEGVACYQDLGYAVLAGARNDAKPYLFIAGFDDGMFDSLPIQLYSGRLPESDREIVVPAHLATNGGVRYDVGDTLTLMVGRRVLGERTLSQHDPYQGDGEGIVDGIERTYTVVGICQRPAMEARSAPGYTLITRSLGETSSSYTAFIRLKDPSRVRDYVKRIGEQYSCDTNDEVLRFLGLTDDRVFNALLYSVGGVLAALVMVGSVFLIYNAFSISLSERTHQFGILMSVGTTRRQLRGSVLFEGLCIGAIGIPLGLLMGLPGIKLVLRLVEKNFANVLYDGVPLNMVVSLPALGAAAAISLATILISAWPPARRAAAVPVMACVRQTDDIKADVRTAKVPPIVERAFGLYGALAVKSCGRNRRRYRSVILSLSLSVILTVAASAFGHDMRALSKGAEVYTTYDIAVSMDGADDGEVVDLYDGLRNAAGVTGGSCQILSRYAARVNPGDLSEEYRSAVGGDPSAPLLAEAQFMDDEAFLETVRALGLDAAAYMNGDRLLALGVLMFSDGQSHELEDFQDVFAKTSVNVSLSSRTTGESLDAVLDIRRFAPEDTPPVAVAEAHPYMLWIVAPWSVRDKLPATEVAAKGLTFTSDNPGLSAAVMQQTLEGLGGGYIALNVHAMLEQSRNILFVADLFSALFIAMMTLIAIANVYNTVSTSLRLRRRELAMLRSVGMSDADFAGMMRFECLLYSLKTMLWGLPLSALAAYAIYRLPGSGELPFALPWQGMLLSAAGVAVIVSAATFSVVRRLRRENIIDARGTR